MNEMIAIERTYRYNQGVAAPVQMQIFSPKLYLQPATQFYVSLGGSIDLHTWNTTLERISKLEQGWDGYEAESPSKTAIVHTRAFLESFVGEGKPFRVAPSVVGGVGVLHKKDGKRVYVEFYNDGEVHALFSGGETDPFTKRVNASSANFRELCKEIRDYLNA